jgi:hypothetical protein
MNTFSSIESVFGGFAVKSSTASTPPSYTATGTYSVSQSGSVYTLTFTSAGSGTLKIVSSNTAITILVVGGGGGGGGSNQTTSGGRGGAGGGGGGIAYANTVTFTSNSTYNIVVGSASSGGLANNGTGGSGGSSSITGTGISMTGNGGGGGGGGKSDNTATVAGTGGTATGGTTNYTGGNGGYTLASDSYVSPGAAQSITINSAAYYSGGGTNGKINGGSDPFSGSNVLNSVYGYGGTGAAATSSSNRGSDGRRGVVIVKFTLA